MRLEAKLVGEKILGGCSSESESAATTAEIGDEAR